MRSRCKSSRTWASRTHRRTPTPLSPRSWARVVPQLPAPMTATGLATGESKVRLGFGLGRGFGLAVAEVASFRHLGPANHPFFGFRIHQFDALGDPADEGKDPARQAQA